MVLYRKYRSKNFSELLGQESIKDMLIYAVSNDSLSHAYLFSGPRGTGKTSTARLFAKAVNCLRFDQNNDVCNDCENCNLINAGGAIDIIEMDAASNRGIDEIRNLRDTLNYLPANLKYKILIIDEVHMLTKEAFNALLKTLEEPPEHVLFVLATTEPHKLPITILSRVMRFDYKLASEAQIIAKLAKIAKKESVDYEDGALKLIYKHTGGSFRDAESLFDKVISDRSAKISHDYVKDMLGIIEDEVFERLVQSILSGEANGAVSILDEIYDGQPNVTLIIDQLTYYCEEQLISKAIETGSIDGNLKAMIEGLIEIKRATKEFDNAYLVLKSGVLRLMGEFSGVVKSEHSPAEEPLITKKTTKVEAKAEVKPEPLKGGFETPLISFIRGEGNSRLAAILEGSRLELNGEEFTIRNKYKFNVSFMEKPESKALVAKYFKEKEGKGVRVMIMFDENTNVAPKNTETASEPKPFTTGVATEPSPEKPQVKRDKSFDNTELVEKIFGV